jgi:hypothetical protein
VLRHFDRRDRISVISAITVSPRRRRLHLYFQLHFKNIQQYEARAFVRHLLRHLRGHIFLLWDGGRPHTGRLVKLSRPDRDWSTWAAGTGPVWRLRVGVAGRREVSVRSIQTPLWYVGGASSARLVVGAGGCSDGEG